MLKRLISFLLAGVMALVAFPARAVELNYGYDVSYPQGNRVNSLPIPGPFTVVGVNGGRAFYPNEYLSSLLDWAGPNSELYLNTGNPGPVVRTWETAPRLQPWPIGLSAGSSQGIKICDSTLPDSKECAYVYGYLAAQYSYNKAKAVFDSKGWGNLTGRTWWLDVETVNSWRGLTNRGVFFTDQGLTLASAQARNVEYIKASVYFLRTVAQVQTVGIYSTTYQWGLITGGNVSDFADVISWHAVGSGATAETRAKTLCASQPGFTGGQKVRVQYVDDALDLDVNVPCTVVKASVKTAYVGVKSVKVKRTITLKVSLKTTQGMPVAKRPVVVTFAGKKHLLTTGASGSASKKIVAPKYRGNYKLKVSFEGSEILKPASTSATIRLYR